MTRNTNQTAALDRLLNLERLSLANYLQHAQPWVGPADAALHDAVRRIAREQLDCARRVAHLLMRRKAGVRPAPGFPARYTAYNDLDLRYLLGRLMEDHERIVREAWDSLADLRGDPEAEQLATEVLSREQAHLKMLRQFEDRPAVPDTGLACAA